MRLFVFAFACVIALSLAQEYSMGTFEQPKADLPADDKLIIQNTVFCFGDELSVVCSRRLLEEGH